ncbi:MAG: DUF4382 domain-containing protein [Planctomycetota bacterium]
MRQIHPGRRLGSTLATSLSLVLSALLAGCGGSGGSGSDATETQGDVVIGLTDAEGDFLAYIVDVKSLELTHASGAVVETLPLSARVDFAQQTELTEFLTAATVPSGRYTKASIVLDYTLAQIVVEDASGNAKDGVAVDEQGQLLGELELQVFLSDSHPFIVAPGVPAYITLDFDLEATNTADLSTDPATVTVEPILIADTQLEDPKPHRVRGLLRDVDVEASVFWIRLRPFTRLNGNFGRLKVTALPETVYEIDGQGYTGTDGLQALDLMPPTTAVVVYGQLNVPALRFEALEVYAGTSVPWGDDDLATGNVVARSGDVLTLRGVTLVRSDNSIIFHDEVAVTVGPETKVMRQGSPGDAFDKDDISVGQHLTVAGTLTNDIPGSLEMDVTHGYARLLYTNLNGTIVQVFPLVLDLQSINGRRIALFDFTGTGLSEDADPENYEIDTGSLSLDDLAVDDPIKVRGFVERFGTAPPDFAAQTIVAVEDLPALMEIHWRKKGTPTPFLSMSPDELVIDLTSGTLGDLHHVWRAGVATDLLELGTTVSAVPANAEGLGLYTIAQNLHIQVFTDFATFEGALDERLDGVTKLDHFHARGLFDDSVPVMSARGIIVRLR